MIGLRPSASKHYLQRDHLLKLLPDIPGYVTWLEAPYGYGKSVLATQWAERLEKRGWRTSWLSLQGQDPKRSLAQQLELPEQAPWGLLLEMLWEEPTLLVLEDLAGGESLSPLLKRVEGLVLLASRRKLPYPELLRLKTTGRLVHLNAKMLAFTREEADTLFAGRPQAPLAWKRAQGWPLPLHFAALTGEEPEREALLEGLQESLDDAAWRELLLLAALPYLPWESAIEDTRTLVNAGFVQELETGCRLHALLAETVLQNFKREVQETVMASQERLSLFLRGEAFRRVGLEKALVALLESELYLTREAPEAVLDWHAQLPGAPGPVRMLSVGWSLDLHSRREEAVQMFLRVLEHPQATPDHKVTACGWALTCLDSEEHQEAKRILTEGERWVGAARADRVASFLSNAGLYYFHAQEWSRARELFERALRAIPKDDPTAAVIETNLAEIRWEREGDLESYLSTIAATLPVKERYTPYNVPENHRIQGFYRLLLGQRDEAVRHFEEAQLWARHNRLFALIAQAEKAALSKDADGFADLVNRVEAWQDPSASDRVRALWGRTLRDSGDIRGALQVLATGDGVYVRCERALARAQEGSPWEPLEDPTPPELPREPKLMLVATRYRLSRKADDLDELLGLTLVRHRILPGLISLVELPRDRPELAAAYPLEEVLASGWKEAISARHSEIPPLELSVLGDFEARVLGRRVELTSRQREILALLLLRQRREVIGEALWPETSTAKVRNNLNVQLNLLRKTIEPWGVSTYLFEEGLRRTRADLWQLESALEIGDADQVLSLYRGSFAPEVDLSIVSEARRALIDRIVELLQGASAATPKKAEAYLERLLELDPLHEEALQQLLRRLLRRGRRHESHLRLEEFRRHLKEEMDLEPLPETEGILRGVGTNEEQD